jgi:hypothetical protein
MLEIIEIIAYVFICLFVWVMLSTTVFSYYKAKYPYFHGDCLSDKSHQTNESFEIDFWLLFWGSVVFPFGFISIFANFVIKHFTKHFSDKIQKKVQIEKIKQDAKDIYDGKKSI